VNLGQIWCCREQRDDGSWSLLLVPVNEFRASYPKCLAPPPKGKGACGGGLVRPAVTQDDLERGRSHRYSCTKCGGEYLVWTVRMNAGGGGTSLRDMEPHPGEIPEDAKIYQLHTGVGKNGTAWAPGDPL
jgi:hypothetical protein